MTLKLSNHSPKVCVVGLGYIGLPTASVLADHGYEVHGVDIRSDVVDIINRGEIHIHEPHLGKLVKKVVSAGGLHASVSPCEADIFFICVPTPINADKSPDLSYVEAAATAIRPYVRPGNYVILESTSPPRTTEDIIVPKAIPTDLEVGKDVFVAYCPERVLPGRILIEVVENDRIVGGITPECTRRIREFYQTFVRGEVLGCQAIAAEMSKLVENSYRDVNIAFANELSMLCGQLGADPFEVIELANRHPRVNILSPGPGVGGHCISVDPWFLVHAAAKLTPLIRTAREVNTHKAEFVVREVCRMIGRRKNVVIGCLGLAYKADVDDLRESPSLEIARELNHIEGLRVIACDPYVSPPAVPDLELKSLDQVLDASDFIVLLTDHKEFQRIPAEVLQRKIVLDTRGTWRRNATPKQELRGKAA